MIYCINPHCSNPNNDDFRSYCKACNSSLSISEWCYKVIKPLEQSPKGDTRLYEVIDESENLKVLKVLNNNSSLLVKRFQEETKILEQVNHPGIPKLDKKFTFSTSDGSTLDCFTMENIEGVNLEQWLKSNGSISEKQALEWLKQLVEILSSVHEKRFLHLDIKPQNIMRRHDGRIMLIDFSNVRDTVSVGYTPPEQAENRPKPQSDFYALGCTFIYLMTGKHPADIPKDSQTDRLKWRIRKLKVSDEFADLINDLVAPSPEQRPRNTKEILARINKIINSKSLKRNNLQSIPIPSINQVIIILLCFVFLFISISFFKCHKDMEKNTLLNIGKDFGERYETFSNIRLHPQEEYIPKSDLEKECEQMIDNIKSQANKTLYNFNSYDVINHKLHINKKISKLEESLFCVYTLTPKTQEPSKVNDLQEHTFTRGLSLDTYCEDKYKYSKKQLTKSNGMRTQDGKKFYYVCTTPSPNS